MRTYKEITRDNGIAVVYTASNNNAGYVMTSAEAHDMHAEYVRKYNRVPSSRWYNCHFRFERIG